MATSRQQRGRGAAKKSPGAATRDRSGSKRERGAGAAEGRAPRASQVARAANAPMAPPATPAAGVAPVASQRLPRAHKSSRAQFYQDPAIDQLWAVATALTAEVSVLYERLDTVERLLERDGSVSQSTIESFRPDDELARERAQRREMLIERVFQVLDLYGR